MKVNHTIAYVDRVTYCEGKHTAHFACGEGVELTDCIGSPFSLRGKVLVVCWMESGNHLWWASEFKHDIAKAEEHKQRCAEYERLDRICECGT